MKIEFYTKNVYGTDKMYVLDAYIGSKLGRLLGTITINEDQQASISELFGVEWVEVIAPKSK